MKDVAKATNLDVSTISKVLNGGGISVRAKTRDRIFEAAKRLSYQPNSLARNLRLNRTGALGILLPNLINPVYASIVRGAIRRANEVGFVMLVADVVDEKETADVYRKLVQESRVDGMIIAVSTESENMSAILAELPIPHIFVNRRVATGYSVTVDDFKAGYLAAKSFIEAGHTRLAFLGASNVLDTAHRRRQGFTKACSEAGLPPFCDVVGPYTKRGGYDKFLEILAKKNRPTGVFASNLLAGIGALSAAWERGVKIPEDISVISLETEDAIYTSPPLTTIETSLDEMGARSVDEVNSILQGRKPINVVIEAGLKLIVRKSLGPPPKQRV